MSLGKRLRTTEDSEDDSEKDEASCRGRRFPLNCRIPGCDTLDSPDCFIDPSICALCFQFVECSLKKKELPAGANRLEWIWFPHNSTYMARLVFNHYSSIRMLRASAKAGCNFCKLCSDISESSALDEDDRIVLSISGAATNAECISDDEWSSFSVSSLRHILQGRAETHEIRYDFMLAQGRMDCLKLSYTIPVHLAKFPAVNAKSQDSFDLIKMWRKTCTTQHDRCLSQDLPMPRRLLDLSSGPDGVKLVEAATLSSLPEKLHYVALSYCWGEDSGLEATKANLSDMVQSISSEQLPIVVKDAISVCRACGVNFLWVDRLCICQDDVDDWHREATSMANVYGGCDFAISALSSSRSGLGLFHDRHSEPISFGNVRVSYGTWSDQVELFARKRPRTLYEEMRLCPLSQRAWPLQEKILAPAVLHYGRDQLIWECNTLHLLSETGETNDTSELVLRTSDMAGTRYLQETKDLWTAVVEDFTQRKLTFARDRSVALSGIAARLRRDGSCDGRYVAGLWENKLDFQLMWYTTANTQTTYGRSVQPNSNVPTWSWAHRNVPVTPMVFNSTCALSRTARFLFEDDNASQSSLSSTAVEFCAVTMSGYMQEVSYRAIHFDSRPQRSHGETKYNGLPGVGSLWRFDHEPLSSGLYYCIRVLEDKRIADKDLLPRKGDSYYYLVLRKAEPTQPSHFQQCGTVFDRVGLLMLKEVVLNPLEDVFCENGQPLLTNGKWMDVVLI